MNSKVYLMCVLRNKRQIFTTLCLLFSDEKGVMLEETVSPETPSSPHGFFVSQSRSFEQRNQRLNCSVWAKYCICIFVFFLFSYFFPWTQPIWICVYDGIFFGPNSKYKNDFSFCSCLFVVVVVFFFFLFFVFIMTKQRWTDVFLVFLFFFDFHDGFCKRENHDIWNSFNPEKLPGALGLSTVSREAQSGPTHLGHESHLYAQPSAWAISLKAAKPTDRVVTRKPPNFCDSQPGHQLQQRPKQLQTISLIFLSWINDRYLTVILIYSVRG